MRSRFWMGVVAVVLALGLAACSENEPLAVICTEQLVFGLSLEVRDAATGDPIAHDATASIRDGAWSEEVRAYNPGDPNALYLVGAAERRGLYAITVAKPGYAAWDTTGIRVVGDECHVQTVTLKVDMNRVEAR
jgi:hypothetical protein